MKAVDLGLSVLWGEAPLMSPNKYIKERMFTWGDDSYNFSHNCAHEEDDFEELANKGIITDDGFLTPQYDHAYQILGEKWRMPTVEEFKELIDKFEWTWIGDGYAVTGPSKNSIKIPYVLSYRDTGQRIVEDIWYLENGIERKIVSKEIGCFWTNEPSFEFDDYLLSYSAYALYFSNPEHKSIIRISTELRDKKNLIIPITSDSSLLKEDDFTPIKPKQRRPSFIAPDAFIDYYTDESFSDIIPPPIVPNGVRSPLPLWNKLSDKAKVFLNEQWGVSCENEYNKLLNDMDEVVILENALKNNGLI